jgi:hypothetical protein
MGSVPYFAVISLANKETKEKLPNEYLLSDTVSNKLFVSAILCE